MPRRLADLSTPAVVVLAGRLEANLARFQNVAEREGCRLRPHVKTHRCPPLARLQLAHGAAGLAVAKLAEAEGLLRAGIETDMAVVYPIVGRDKLRRLAELTDRLGGRITTIVDSTAVARGLVQAVPGAEALLWVDTGLGRAGLEWNAEDSLRTALEIAAMPDLTLVGVGTHGGFAYSGARPPREAMRLERDRLLAFRARLEERGLSLPEVSLGSTPTVAVFENTPDRAVTELRPGNYVFLDWTQVRLGVADVSQCALFVLSTVVSVRRDGTAILDAGSKTLSSDLGAHGSGPGAGPARHAALAREDAQTLEPDAGVFRLSEEHGFLRPGKQRLHVGDRVLLLPAHACAVAYLTDRLVLADESDGAVLETWPTLPRGNQ